MNPRFKDSRYCGGRAIMGRWVAKNGWTPAQVEEIGRRTLRSSDAVGK